MDIPEDIMETARIAWDNDGRILTRDTAIDIIANAMLTERQRCAILVQLHPVATSFKAREEIAAAILSPSKQENA